MYVVNINFWVQEILTTSVKFDGNLNNPNIQTVPAIQNTQRQEKQVILSTIQGKKRDSFTGRKWQSIKYTITYLHV